MAMDCEGTVSSRWRQRITGSCTAVLLHGGGYGAEAVAGKLRTRRTVRISIPTAIDETSEGGCEREQHCILQAPFSGRRQQVFLCAMLETQEPITPPDVSCRSRFPNLI